VDLRQDKQALQRIRDAAEKAKIELTASSGNRNQSALYHPKDSQPVHLNMKLTRAKLEGLVADLIEKTIKPVESALKTPRFQQKISMIILVGGMTRMPKVVETVKNFLAKSQISQ
jgi:molecular chaperone DnaK